MVRILRAADAGKRRPWRDRAAVDVRNDEPVPVMQPTSTRRKGSPSAAWPVLATTRSGSSNDLAASPAVPSSTLSVRAENALKELALELTGESPPKGRWIPSDKLLQRLTYRHLQTARNCGPQTIHEIITWAGQRGVVIRPPFHAGKSLSAMWRDIVARFSSGEFTEAEIAEALERSTRRKNTQIPVAFQNVLLKVLNSTGR
jgi:hypothetical protein